MTKSLDRAVINLIKPPMNAILDAAGTLFLMDTLMDQHMTIGQTIGLVRYK